ncbi:MAG: hypothetical protein KA536_15200 [Saprospiraceae bacterium]|nr:hypothetical protein [Saprospiraceae bacterium]
MNELATYTFLPWLRQGIANQISNQTGNRATIPVELVVHGDKVGGGNESRPPIKKEVQIYGPGDVVGIDPKAIVKVEPRNWITNFEPNYLPYIEFYDEDFPWRYSPMPNPSDHRLLPWIALVVLKVNEFSDGKNIKDRPLPYIKLTANAKLPKEDQSWAWAHVHVNRNLIGDDFISTNKSGIESHLEALLNQNEDLAYSRIVCPRKLEENEAYHAFLVPVFASGRLAGLGQDPSGADSASALAWKADNISIGFELPYYYRWYFRTGTIGDFEYLVRLLKPKPIDSRVGNRDMDVQAPGANIQGIIDDPGASDEQKLEGILKLGGALKVPDIFYTNEEFEIVEKYRNWATLNGTKPYPHPFQKDVAAFINLTDSYVEKSAALANSESNINETQTAEDYTKFDIKNNPDPLITAPLYGRWHALTQRLLKERDNETDLSPNNNWIHELNLDPRWRVSAGLGTKIVQENQENYMKAAWDQIGEVLEANKKIREGQLAKVVSEIWYNTHLRTIKEKNEGKWLSVSSPVHKRVIANVALDNNYEEGFIDPATNQVSTRRIIKGTDGKEIKKDGQLTVSYQRAESKLTPAATSVNMRKVLRPRGKIARRLNFNETRSPFNLITRINAGEVSAAPPKVTPDGIQTPKDIADLAKFSNVPDFILDFLERYPWIKWIPLILAFIIFLLLAFFAPAAALMSLGVVAICALIYIYRLLDNLSKKIANANSILEENQTPESIDELHNSPDFRISAPGENFTPTIGGTTDSDEAIRFKLALKDVNGMLQETAKLGKVVERPEINISAVNNVVFEKIHPELTIPRWIYGGIKLPPFVVFQIKETFVEAKAYPKFDIPMYKPLADYSSELFLPNINYVAQNSISIVETNQKFIESYMVGLNHEFARELLWREYPTDQRGSYFRQFWEVNSFLDTQPSTLASITDRFRKRLIIANNNNSQPTLELQEYYDKLRDNNFEKDEVFLGEAKEAVLKEELKDIKPLHYWSKFSKLGDHDNRELPGENEEEVVLVIRGELLKKYPTAVIYAHKAVWQDKNGNPVLNSSQTIDLTKERTLAPIASGQEDKPPTSIIKSPLFEAKVDPDIYFFGFDLTVCKAKGGTGKADKPVDERCADEVDRLDAGWFFVIKERPGEPRFGLDIGDGGNVEPDGKIELWNDLSWGDLTPQVADGEFIQITNQTPTITADQPLEGEDLEKQPQQVEDKLISWHKDMNAAELAYILYQVPVLVAVHASEMLPNNS